MGWWTCGADLLSDPAIQLLLPTLTHAQALTRVASQVMSAPSQSALPSHRTPEIAECTIQGNSLPARLATEITFPFRVNISHNLGFPNFNRQTIGACVRPAQA